MKVYVAHEGDYSDRHPIGVFSSRERAEEMCRLQHMEGGCDIEEFELDELPECPPGLLAWQVNMKRDGSCRVYGISPDRMKGRLVMLPLATSRQVPSSEAYILVWAKSREHAAKVANEKRTQLIATDPEWSEWV